MLQLVGEVSVVMTQATTAAGNDLLCAAECGFAVAEGIEKFGVCQQLGGNTSGGVSPDETTGTQGHIVARNPCIPVTKAGVTQVDSLNAGFHKRQPIGRLVSAVSGLSIADLHDEHVTQVTAKIYFVRVTECGVGGLTLVVESATEGKETLAERREVVEDLGPGCGGVGWWKIWAQALAAWGGGRIGARPRLAGV